jgi:drug/metabolite transporter (DMT)-like permease
VKDRNNIGYLLAFGSAAAGALRYNLAVFANESAGFDYVQFLVYALAIGLLASGIHVAVKDGWRGFMPLRGRFHHALLYGILMGWSTLAHFLALEYLNETTMTSLAQLGILLSLGLAAWILKERLTSKEWIGAVVIFAGMFMFKPWEAGDNRTGFAILMSGVLAGTLASTGAKVWVRGTTPRVLMVWRNLVALVLVYAFSLGRARPEFTPTIVVAVVATGILGPYLHGLFFLMALKHIAASRASLMGRVQPVIVFIISLVFLGRIPAGKEIASAVLLTVGTFWLIRSRPAARI